MTQFTFLGESWDLHTPYPHAMQQGVITPYAQRLILDVLIQFNEDQYSEFGGDFAIHPYQLRKDFIPEDFTWEWKGEGGKITKRLSRLYSNLYRTRLPDRVIQDIGNIASQYVSDGDEFDVIFTDKLDWDRGDFNDPDSCFWTVNSAVHKEFRYNEHLFAVKLYADGHGFARALIYNSGDVLYIFNTYGLMTPFMTSLMFDFLGITEYSLAMNPRFRFTFNGTTTGTLWINNNGYGGVIYVDGNFVTSELRTEHLNRPSFHCHCCGEDIDGSPYWTSENGAQLCEHCFEYHTYECDVCGHIMYDEEETQYTITDNNGYELTVCRRCYERHLRQIECHVCGRTFDPTTEGVYIYNDVDTGELIIGACGRCYRQHTERVRERGRAEREEEVESNQTIRDNNQTRTGRFFSLRELRDTGPRSIPAEPYPHPPIMDRHFQIPLNDYVFPTDEFRLGAFLTRLINGADWHLHQCVFVPGGIHVEMHSTDVIGRNHVYHHSWELPDFLRFVDVPNHPHVIDGTIARVDVQTINVPHELFNVDYAALEEAFANRMQGNIPTEEFLPDESPEEEE